MGWIKRNWFWYEHHTLYIEPTEEEKRLNENTYRKTNKQIGHLLAATAILSSMNDKRRR